MICVQEVGLFGADDRDILACAAQHDRGVLSHDRANMPDYAYERVAAREAMPGVDIFNDRFPVDQAIQEILLMDRCTAPAKCYGHVVYLPL